jgi:DNA-binding transcriptional LysR family regulator
MGYALSSESSEILLHLERAANLREVAEKIGRDVSVVSRRLQALAASTPFLVKVENQWRLTNAGLEFNRWTRNTIADQARFLENAERIRIATTREFAARVLSRSLDRFAGMGKTIEILAMNEGVESLLLDRKADFGFDCGTPYSPSIAFHRGPREEYAIVYSKALGEKVRSVRDLENLPFYFYSRMDLSEIREAYGLKEIRSQFVFQDIASARSAVVHQKGWSVLPRYCVEEELKRGCLRTFRSSAELEATSFGLWWNRENAPRKDVLSAAHIWLKGLKL